MRQAIGESNVARLPFRIVTGPERFQLREQLLTKRSDDLAHRRTIPTDNQLSIAGDEIHQTTERQLYRIEALVNICMVEFDIIDNRDLRQVVHELRAFIEVGRVVLVAFDDEVIAVGDAKADAEVLHYAAHKECRIETSLIDYPRGQTGRRGLSVLAGD